MSEVKKPRKKFAMTGGNRVVLIIVAVMTLILVALTVLERFGLALINGTIMLFGPMVIVFILLGWGGFSLWKRIKSNVTRLIVGSLAGIALFLLLALAFTYLSFVGNITVPQRYNTVTSPSGAHKLVVLRALDPDEDRMNVRREARLAADPDSEADFTVDDYGYVYAAYPQVMGIFYRANVDSDGAVYMNYTNGATLMLEWQNDESIAHLFADQPGAGEGGDFYLYLDGKPADGQE